MDPAPITSVCPFCALACDDLVTVTEGDGTVRPLQGGCGRAAALLAMPVRPAEPLVDGRPVALEAALDRAAALLATARLPLLGGLGTDVDGARAAVALAERAGGVLDHASSPGLMANLRAMQDGGWITATVAEVRNRADLVLLIGTDGVSVADRLIERCFPPAPTLLDPPPRRRFVQLGGARPLDGAEVVPCPDAELGDAVALLRALAEGRAPKRAEESMLFGLPLAGWRRLAADLAAARYPVLVWAAGSLPAPHADLVVGTIAGLLRSLNRTGRAVGLPLAAADNVIGVNQVTTWQTGVPLRVSLASGVPDQDPHGLALPALLARGRGDLLLWIASFAPLPLLPEADGLPTILLARPGTVPERPVAVQIPVATPGLDHAGSIYRMDGVVALPLAKLREAGLPRVGEVLTAIRLRLEAPSAGRAPDA